MLARDVVGEALAARLRCARDRRSPEVSFRSRRHRLNLVPDFHGARTRIRSTVRLCRSCAPGNGHGQPATVATQLPGIGRGLQGGLMFIRAIMAAGVAAGMGLALAVPAADASSGPPPPVSTNGHRVQLVASGLKTPTSFAFGDRRIFVGDGGNSEGSAPPNGGVYVLKNGAAEKIPSPFKFVAGLAWHSQHALRQRRRADPERPEFPTGRMERLERQDLQVPPHHLHRAQGLRRLQRPRLRRQRPPLRRGRRRPDRRQRSRPEVDVAVRLRHLVLPAQRL